MSGGPLALRTQGNDWQSTLAAAWLAHLRGRRLDGEPAPIAFGVVWGVPEVHRVEPARTEHEIGSNYIAALPPSRFAPLLSIDGDTLEKASRSTLALFEDGRELGPPHAQHAWIREYGGGLFSHWGSSLYFSSSDNSDPRTNGRLYTVRTSARLPFVAAWV